MVNQDINQNIKSSGKPFIVPDRKVQLASSNSNVISKSKYSNISSSSSNKTNVSLDRKAANIPMKLQNDNSNHKHNNQSNNINSKKNFDNNKSNNNNKSNSNDKNNNNKNIKKSNPKALIQSNISSWWEQSYPNDEIILEFNENQPWYDMIPTTLYDNIDPRSSGKDSFSIKLQGERLEKAKNKILFIYNQELLLYETKLKSSLEMKNELKWINDMITSGTMSDKVAAMTLKIQGNPFYNLTTLDNLITIAYKKEQRTSQLALEALKDLFINNLLPNHPLRSLDQNILNHKDINISYALLMWYESQLKIRYMKLLDALEVGLKSTIDYFKRECLKITSELLIGKPEQEAKLLEMMINKLGDPSRSTCSKAIEVLKNVMQAHPAMRLVIIKEIRQFLYRPNLKIRPIFNGIILLSQISVHRGDHLVAVQLIEGYLSLFDKTLQEKEYGSRLLSSLLTGINKALPYLQSMESFGTYVDPLFRIAHTATSFTTATQALMLLSHLIISSTSSLTTTSTTDNNNNNSTNNRKMNANKHNTDTMIHKSDIAVDKEEKIEGEEEFLEHSLVKRYYRALYAKLLSEQITTRSKNTAFLNLLYRSIKNDSMPHRAMAFIKRLLICASQSSPSIAGGILYLISEIIKERPNLKSILNTSNDTVEENEDHQYIGNFNINKREPEYAYQPDSQPTGSWEIQLLKNHYHPSIKAFAISLLTSPTHSISFTGDPTIEFNLMSFLNRFAYKNPKKSMTEKILKGNNTTNRSQISVEDPINLTIAQESIEDLAPDKLFYHKYFIDKQNLISEGKSRDKSKSKSKVFNEDNNETDELDEEAEIDKFADQLAEELMRNANSNIIEDLEFSDDDEEDDEDDIPDDIQNEDFNEHEEEENDSDDDDMNWDEGINDKYHKKIISKDIDVDEESSDDGYAGQLEAYHDSDDDNENHDDDKLKIDSKMKKRKNMNHDNSDFADADEYEEVMEEIVNKYSLNTNKAIDNTTTTTTNNNNDNNSKQQQEKTKSIMKLNKKTSESLNKNNNKKLRK